MSNESLFDAIAKLLPPEQRERFYQRMAYLRKLGPNDEILQICEVIGFLALITRETPEKIAAQRAELERLFATNIEAMQKSQETTMDFYRRVQARMDGLPSEIATGFDAEAIARRVGEGMRLCLEATALPETADGLRHVAASLQAAMKDFSAVASGFSHPQHGAVVKVNLALQQMEQRLGLVLRYLDGQLQKLRWGMWSGVAILCGGCVLVGIVLGLLLAHALR